MNDEIRPEREYELSVQFDLGKQTSGNPEEEKVLNDYLLIQDHIRSYPVWKLNVKSISNRIAQASNVTIDNTDSRRQSNEQRKKTAKRSLHLPWLRPILAGIGIVAIVSAFFIGQSFFVRSHPIEDISFSVASDKQPSFLWHQKLKKGKSVNTGENGSTLIRLNDGSTINCAPNTQLAIHYGKTRDIELNAGRITVDAAPNPKRKMIIHTPYVDVVVKGTKFTVKVY